jgi:hypothetical protein
MKWPGCAEGLRVMVSESTHNVLNVRSTLRGVVALTNGRHVLAGIALASDEQWAPLQVWLLVKEP